MSQGALTYLRRQYLCVLRRCAFLNAFSSWLLLAAPMAMAGQAGIVTDGRTATTLTQAGAVTDVTTATVKGSNAFNSFSRFNIGSGQTVNLHVPKQAANLLNLVRNERSQIDGVMNAYKDGRIGGNVFFFNPHGMAVGAQGQINVGSLTVATPTPAYMERLIGPGGVIDDAAVDQALRGEIPLSESGLITVKGSVKAARAVQLAAANVSIDGGARIEAGAAAHAGFGALVNIDGLEAGAQMLQDGDTVRIVAADAVNIAGAVSADGAAGEAAGRIRIDAGGDITVADGGRVSADGHGANSDGGKIRIWAEDTATLATAGELSARGGEVSGDGGHIEFSATEKVRLEGGTLKANATSGKRGAVLIDPNNIEAVTANTHTDGADFTLIANDKITVDTGITISTRDIANPATGNHATDASQGDSGDLTLRASNVELKTGSRLLAHATPGHTAGDVLVEGRTLDAIGVNRDVTASVSLTEATVTGKDITLRSSADTSLVQELLENDPNLSLADAQRQIDQELDDPIDGIGGAFLSVTTKATATTTVLGSKVTGSGKVTISSHAGARSGFEKIATATTTIGDSGAIKSEIHGDTVDITATATTSLVYKILGTATKLLDQSWLPDPDGPLITALDDNLFDFNAVPLVALSTAKATTLVDGASLIIGTNTVTIGADATSAAKPTFSSPFLFAAAWGESTAEARARVVGTANITATNALTVKAHTDTDVDVSAVVNSINKPVDATFVRANTNITTLAEVGDTTTTTGGAITVDAQTKAEIIASADARNMGGSGVGLSLAISETTSSTTATLGGTAEAKTGDVTVTANADIEEGNSANAATLGNPSSISAKITNFKAGIQRNVVGGILAATGKINPATADRLTSFLFPGIKEGKFNAAGAVAWSTGNNTATASIAPLADVKAAGGVSVTSKITDRPGSSAGAKTSSTGSAVGGSVAYGSFVNTANAFIGAGATVDAKGALLVDAQTHVPYPWQIDWDDPDEILRFLQGGVLDMFLTTYSINSAKGKSGIGLAVGVNLFDLDNNATATIDEGAQINTRYTAIPGLATQSVKVSAKNDISLTGAVGILSKKFLGTSGGKAALGGSAGLISIDTNASATIRGNATVNSANAVDVDATNIQRVVTVTEAGGSSDAVGIEGAVSINTLTNTSTAAIDDDATVDAGDDITVNAKGDLENISVAGGVVATKGQVGIGFSVSVNTIVSDVAAYIGNFDPLGLDLVPALGNISTTGKVNLVAASEVSQGAYSVAGAVATNSKAQTDMPAGASDTQDGAGSGSASKSGKGKFGVAVSADVSINDVKADTAAYLSDGVTVSQATAVDLDATNTLALSALSGAVTISTQQSGNALAGSYAQNSLAGTTAAYADDATLTLSGPLTADAKTTGTIETLSASVAGTKGKLGVAGSVSINAIDNATKTYLSKVLLTGVSTVGLTALDDSTIRAIAGAIAFGGKAGIGLSFSWNQLDNDTESWIANSDVDATGLVSVAATTDNSIDTISAAIGASKGPMAGAAAVTINTIDNSTQTWIAGTRGGDGVDSAASIALQSTDSSRIFGLAGALGATTGSAGVGVTFAWNDVDNIVDARLKNNANAESTAGDVTVKADSSTHIEGISAAGGVSGKAGVAGAGTVVQANNSVKAGIDAGSTAIADGNVHVGASDDVDLFSLAGNVAGGGKAGIGASASVLITDNTVEARIDGSATGRGKRAVIDVPTGEKDSAGNLLTESTRGVAVTATSHEDIETIAAGGSGGGSAGVAGSATVTDLTETTTAAIGSGATLNPLDDGASTQDVTVRASDETTLLGVAGAVAFGGSGGVGAGAEVGLIDKTTTASVAGNLKANDTVTVEARNAEDITSVAASLSVGGSAGIAGSASVYVVDVTTKGEIADGAIVHSDGNVIVSADDDNEIDMIAGNGAFGGSAGIGASAAVAILTKTTTARVGIGATVDALGTKTGVTVADGSFATTYTANGTDEGEISAPAASNPDGSDSAALTGQRTASRGTATGFQGLAVTATNKDDVETISATGAGAGSAAITLAGDVNVITTTTTAEIADNAQINQNTGAAAGQSVLVAAGNDHYQMGIAGSASGAGAVGIGAAADVLVAKHTTMAKVGDSADLRARKDVSIEAHGKEEILSIAAGLGVGGTVGVAGSTSVLSMTNVTTATTGTGSVVDADGNVRIVATDDTETDVVDGTLAIGLGAAGVGGAVGVTRIEKDTTAGVGAGATVNARGNATASMQALSGNDLSDRDAITGLMVEANSSEDLFSVAASGAGGFYAGVSGAVTVTSLDSDTTAVIGSGALINQGVTNGSATQDVNVSAKNHAKLDAYTGSLAAGAVGAAGGVDVGTVKNDTTALIDDSAQVNAKRDVDVNALTDADIDSITVSAAGGLGAIAGGVSVYSVGSGLDAEGRKRLKSDSGDFGDVNSYADDQAGDGSINSLLAGSDDARIRDAGTQSQTARAGVSISGDLARANTAGTTATIGSASVTTGGAIDIDARQDLDIKVLAGGASVGGVGLGVGVGVVAVNAGTAADVAALATLNAGGTLSAHAHTKTVSDLTGFAGSYGGVAIDAALAFVTDNSSTRAALGDGVQVLDATGVTVSASDDRKAESEAVGVSVSGGAAVGASVATATLGGSTTASAGDNLQLGQSVNPVDSLSVTADSSTTAKAESIAGKAGIGLAASGSVATAKTTPTVSATIGDNSRIKVSGSTDVSATGRSSADADAIGVNVSGGVGIGASVATATSAPDIDATIGAGARITANQVRIAATQAILGSGTSAYALGAAGGLLAGVNATYAESNNTGKVDAKLGDNSALVVASSVNVDAINNTRQRTDVTGVSIGGVLAAGATIGHANSDTETHASLGNGVQVASLGGLTGLISVTAVGTDDNIATAVSGSGGLISGSAASVGTFSESDTSARVGSGDATHSLNATTFTLKADHTSQFNAKVDSVSASAVGASGSKARHTVESTVEATVADNGRINANHVDIDANNRAHKFWWGATSVAADAAANADSAAWNIQSGSGGALNAAAGSSHSTVKLATLARIGQKAEVHVLMPALGTGTFSMDAFNDVIGHDKSKLDSGGLVAIAATETYFTATGFNGTGNDATVEFGASAKVTSDTGDIKAGARAKVDIDTRASSDTYGLAGAPMGEAYSTWTGNNKAVVNTGAHLLADQGGVHLGGGQASDGTRTDIEVDSDVHLWNKTAFPINSDPDARSHVTSNASVQLLGTAAIETAGDITLAADKGKIDAHHVGIGKDIYREAASGIVSGISNALGGDDVSFDIEGGETVVGGTSTAQIDGTALAGSHRFESLTLEYELVDANGNVVASPVTGTDGRVLWRLKASKTDGVSYTIDPAVGLAANIQKRIDKLRSLMEQYAGDPVAVGAYESEIKFLQFKLVELGLASGDPNGTNFNTGNWNNPSPKAVKLEEIDQKEAQIDNLGNDIVSTTDGATTTTDGALSAQNTLTGNASTVVVKADNINGNNTTIRTNLAGMGNFNAADTDYLSLISLQSSAATLRGDINTLQGQLVTDRSALAASNGTIDTLLGNIATRQSQIDTLLANGGAQSQIDALRALNDTDRSTATTELGTTNSLLAGIATKSAQLDQKASTLSSTYTSINGLQTTLRSRFANGSADAGRLTSIINLQGTNTGLRSDVSTLAGGINSADTTVSGASTTVAGNLGTVQGLETDLGTAETDLVALEAQLPGLSDVPANGPIADFIHVDDITVRLGNIDVTADNLIGSGALRAPGDAKISIVNNTPDFLVLGKLTVDSDSGGEVRQNGFLINDTNEIRRINANNVLPTLTLETKHNNNAGLPEIEVISNYDPNSAKNANLPAPAPDIQFSDDVSNPLGLVRVYSQAGSIYVDGDIRAAQVDVRADNGDFVQSFVDGFYHSSGDPAANVQGGQTTTPAGKGIVANGSVFISARYLNINGLVQSGIEAWNITLPTTPVLTGPASLFGLSQSALDTLIENWKNHGGPQYTTLNAAGGTVLFNAALGRIEADASYAHADMGTAGWAQRTSAFGGLYPLISDYGNIGASYDPSVTGGRFVLDGEAVKGGYIQLYGQILNTAGAASRLKVLDGFGQITVTNPTDRAVVVNNISTGTDADGSGRGIRGVIDITDIQGVDTSNGTSTAIHTVITRENNTVMIDQTGRWEGSVFNPNYRFTGADAGASDGRNTTYDPQTGLRYVWTTATDKSTNTYWHFSGSQFLGISALRTRPSGKVESKSGPFTTGTRRLDDGTYLVRDTGLTGTPLKTNTDTRTTSDYWTKTKEWTDCNWWTICIAQDYHTKWTQTTGTQTITTFSLKADYPINIQFSGRDTGLVAINSKSDVTLNGLINNRFGDTTITAGVNPGTNAALVKAGQSILQGSDNALVTGQSLNFAASYSVGTTGSNANPVNIDLNGGTLNAAVANGNLALRQANGDLSIGLVSAGGNAAAGLGQLLIAADGNLSMAGPLSSISGNKIELVSDNGSIGSLADPVRVKAGFTTNLAERRYYGVTATARKGIFLDSESWIGNLGADLLVSRITSATGDVQVRTPGRIIDNNPFETRDERTYAQLLTLWEELSLLENTTKNADKQQAAIAAFEAGASQEYRAYWQMRNQQADPSSFDASHTVTLTTAQETAMRDSLAQQGKTQTEIDNLVRDYSKDRTDAYRALHDKLYVTPAYDNLIPAGYQDGFAYVATQAERDAHLKGSSWSEQELGIAFSSGLLKETTDTNPVLKDPNVAGINVTLKADQGIGETGLTRNIDLTQNPGLISDDDKVALAAAERSDLSINGGIASVTQRKPVVVGSDGQLMVTNRAGNAVAGDVFLASESSVNVAAILASGELRLKTAGDIIHGAGPGVASFTASSLILESAKGSIGSAAQPVLVQLGDNDPLIARADGDIFITQLGNDLAVDTLFSRAGIWLTAPGSILDAFNTDETNLRAQTLNLLAGGSLGTAGNFLDIGLGPRLESDTDDTGYLTAQAGTGAFLRSPTLPLILHQVGAGTELRVIGGTDVVVEGAVTAPVNVDIAAGDDVRFEGGQIATDTVAISAGSDGTGNVVGSLTAGPDIIATTSAFITAPQGIGSGDPLEVRTPQLDLQADTIDVVATPLTPAQPLMVNASGVGGTMADNVKLDLASTSSVTIGTLFANTSQTTATTPLFTVTDGQLGDYAAFYTPAFAIRVDHQNRAFQPGFDVRAFTLSGLYDMVVTPQSAAIGAYIITKNPRKVVFSDPGGVADLRSRGQLNALDHQSKNDKSNRVAAGAAENYATAAGGLVFVDPNLFDCGEPGEKNDCEDL